MNLTITKEKVLTWVKFKRIVLSLPNTTQQEIVWQLIEKFVEENKDKA